jgi:hypothetical protein
VRDIPIVRCLALCVEPDNSPNGHYMQREGRKLTFNEHLLCVWLCSHPI